jgi:hypothetical protein
MVELVEGFVRTSHMSDIRQRSVAKQHMVVSSAGLGPESGCSGKV